MELIAVHWNFRNDTTLPSFTSNTMQQSLPLAGSSAALMPASTLSEMIGYSKVVSEIRLYNTTNSIMTEMLSM